MSILSLIAIFIGINYNKEDFHYYDETLQGRGLTMVNKVYVDLPGDRKEFLKFLEKKKMEHFKDIKTDSLNGVLLAFDDKNETLAFLNECTEKAYPVVIYDGIECTTTGEIVVGVHPSVNKVDFISRLGKISDGEFAIVEEFKPKAYVVSVKNLKNPSNILILANLVAKDVVWVRYAMVQWIPLDGYVNAVAEVISPAINNLGELRNLRVTINVNDPNIKVRTDLLSQLGQSLFPFPFAGEVWFDLFPPQITEVSSERGKTITVNYPFKQLQYGSFAFQPILISYEKDGKLLTTKTNLCQYTIHSVIGGTDIEDIQPRPDGVMNLRMKSTSFTKAVDPMAKVYNYIKMIGSFVFFTIAVVLFADSAMALKRKVSGWFTAKDTTHESLWKKDLALLSDWRNDYEAVIIYLNKILIDVFGVSLYSIKLTECNENFRALMLELNKVYNSEEKPDRPILNETLMRFRKERNYK